MVKQTINFDSFNKGDEIRDEILLIDEQDDRPEKPEEVLKPSMSVVISRHSTRGTNDPKSDDGKTAEPAAVIRSMPRQALDMNITTRPLLGISTQISATPSQKSIPTISGGLKGRFRAAFNKKKSSTPH